MSKIINAENIQARLTRFPCRAIKIFDTLDSTNTYLKGQAHSLPDRSVVIALAQTAGRGRRGRSFYSPAGRGLYMSVLIKKDELRDIGLLTAAAGVSAAQAISAFIGDGVGIKWVNDILYENKKLCGVLCEGISDGGGISSAVVGMGVNLTGGEYPDDIKDIAASVESVSGKIVSAADMAVELINRLDANLMKCGGDIIEVYREKSCVIGRDIVFSGAQNGEGRAVGISEDGALEVVTYSRIIKLRSGEISIRTK